MSPIIGKIDRQEVAVQSSLTKADSNLQTQKLLSQKMWKLCGQYFPLLLGVFSS